jgi:hypothetical protein
MSDDAGITGQEPSPRPTDEEPPAVEASDDVSPAENPGEPPPRTLEDFLNAKSAPTEYFKEISKNRASPPDEESRLRAVEIALREPRALARAIDLARAAADEKVEGRTRRAIMAFGSELVRSSADELAEWGTIGTVSTDSEIGLLGRRLRRARASKDKEAAALAEATLLIGFSVSTSRTDFDVIGALAALSANLHDQRPTGQKAGKDVQRALRRASTKSLENFALVNTLVASKLEESSRQLSQSAAQNQLLRDQVRSLQEQVAGQRERITELEGEISGVSLELSEAQGHIAGVKGGAAHEMIEVKARSRQFLAKNVKPALQDAEEALLDPPYLDVVRERIKTMIADVEKELTWLNQSSE